MICFGEVPSGAVLPIYFDSFAAATGAPITISGLATTDIEVVKGTSVTVRASDSGYALLDTDGIDIGARTGIHGFTIDTGDNADAGFYAVGAYCTVLVDAVTIDGVTVRFVAATFRIKAAEAITGKAKVDVDAWLGTAAATPTTNGVPEVDITHVAGSAVSTSSAQIGVNVVNAGGTAWASGSLTSGVFASGAITATAIAADAIGASELAADAATEIANAVWDTDATGRQTQGTFGQAIGDPGADTNTLFKAVVTDATGATVGVDVAAVLADTGTDGVVVASINNGAITAAAIATDAIDADALAADAVTEIQSGLATAAALDTVDNFLDTEVAAILAAVDTEVAAILADTDDLQTRVPAALVGGRMDSSVGAMAANTLTAAATAADFTTEIQTGVLMVPKNVAYTNFTFEMVDETDGFTLETGLTVSGVISKDGGAFAALTNAVSEVGASSMYKVDLEAAELNANEVFLRFTATGARRISFKIRTQR